VKLKFSLEEAKKKAEAYIPELHCGPTVLKVMWEAYGWKDENLLWAGTAFRGGMAGEQEGPCGAVAGMALALGLRHRYTGADKAKAEQEQKAACDETAALVKDFKEKWGAIDCLTLAGVDFKDEEAVKQAKEAGTLAPNCEKQVNYAIEQLYELESRR
jgi:C_GCAxxG_C_C family probable redox protein